MPALFVQARIDQGGKMQSSSNSTNYGRQCRSVSETMSRQFAIKPRSRAKISGTKLEEL